MRHTSLVVVGLMALVGCSQGPTGAQGLPGPAGPTGPAGLPSGYFDVLAYGATVDLPSFDSTASFQKALDAAEAAGGGIVWVPRGRFWFSGNLTIGPNVALAGAGIGPYDPYPDPTANTLAPTLLPMSTSGPAFISIKGQSSALRDLLIHYPNQVRPDAPGVETTGPTVYPPTVLVLGPSKIFGCSLDNSYTGVQVMVGRVYLENLHIGAYRSDVIIDNAQDFVHLSHITASVFWDTSLGLPVPQPLDAWVMNHGIALTSYRMDALSIEDFDVYLRDTGIALLDSPHGFGATYGTGVNIDIDSVHYGVIAKSVEGVGFQFTNLAIGALDGVNMIWLPAGGARAPHLVVEGGSTWGPTAPPWAQALKVEAGTLRVRDIVGLNPIGALPALGISVPALPPSGVPYVSAMPTDARVSISGGSVQGVLVGGTSTGLTSGMFPVSPGQSITVVYTSAPVWNWFLE